ncbi:MAG: hypothetical protein QF411_14035 [Planctomycetota bacterium]|nr:hypothetical protein [Planctomycetota bacterium]
MGSHRDKRPPLGSAGVGQATAGLRPGQAPRPRPSLPSSKSEAIRVLLCASLARGTSRVSGRLVGEDTESARALVAARGGELRPEGAGYILTGRPPGNAPGSLAARPGKRPGPWPVGESGTLARLALAVAGLCSAPGTETVLEARGSLLPRPVAPNTPLARALCAAGVLITAAARDQDLTPSPARPWPLTVVACPDPPDQLTLKEPLSSQEVSALLLALSALGGTRRLTVEGSIPSRPYVDLTVAVLKRFGVEIAEQGRGQWTVTGPLLAPAAPMRLEEDASAAAVVLAGACLVDRELHLPGLRRDSLQGDRRILVHLAAFGCRTSFDGAGECAAASPTRAASRVDDSAAGAASEAKGDAEGDAKCNDAKAGARAGGLPLHGAELDLSGEPDLAPVLATVAAAAALGLGGPPATSRLTGLGTLVIKESDRLAVLARGLRCLGLSVTTGRETLTIGPRKSPEAPLAKGTPPYEAGPTPGGRPKRVLLDPHGDHRMAFAFALLGLLRPGLEVLSPECVAKSWPDFWYQWLDSPPPDGST